MRAVLCALIMVAALAWCAPAFGAGWLPAEEVAPAGSQPATTEPPVVAMTPAGDVFAAWTASGGSFAYRVRRAFTGYAGDPHRFPGNDLPAVTVDADGRIWLATHLGGVVQVVRSSATDPDSFPQGQGGSFIAPGAVTDLDVAARHDEGAVVFVNAGQVKLGRWTPTGGAVAPNAPLYDGSMNAADHAKVSLDAAGNLVAAFTISSQTNLCRVAAVRIPAGGSPIPLQDIGSTGSADGGCSFFINGKELNDNVDLALGPSGRVLASWYRNGPSHAGIDTAVAPPGGAFGAGTTVASDTDAHPLTSNPPSVAHGLLGASDAMLHTYIVRSPDDGFDHAAQLFRAGGGAPGFERDFDIGSNAQHLARNAAEQAVGGWQGSSLAGCHISGAVGTVAGGLEQEETIGGCGQSTGAETSDPRVAIDPAGDAAATWTAAGAVQLAIYDATPPEATDVSAPPNATVGDPVALSAAGRDALSPVTVDWTFDEGAPASGGSVTHTFATAGPHRVVAHLRDEVGNTADVERTVSVGEASGGGSGASSNGSSSNSTNNNTTTTTTTATTTTTTTTLMPPRVPGPTMALLGSRLRASRRGVIRLRLGCPAETPGGCSGTAGLQKGAAPRAFRAAAGATTTAKLKLTRSTRRRLSRRHRIRVTVAVTAHDGQGNEATSSGAYTVLSPRR